MTDLGQRLNQVLSVLALEDELLRDVCSRLFSEESIDAKWLMAVLANPVKADCMESFTSKFCRMQDNLVDKWLPLYLQSQGEKVGSAIDNLRKLERLGLLASAESWVEMRLLRNRLVHEYMHRPELMLEQLLLAREQAAELSRLYAAVSV